MALRCVASRWRGGTSCRRRGAQQLEGKACDEAVHDLRRERRVGLVDSSGAWSSSAADALRLDVRAPAVVWSSMPRLPVDAEAATCSLALRRTA
ncbi:hypothetical protein GUJ93_ZPchr0005g15095 [Zizania palustris]|uniref:Uncharacterized protein n=1 Tax=Zizania palustris TaxID=103762 RepID=A0A8J5SHW2_ZIZPA|nr:hypothetical protein GUJ93_ZPchr0005g15095 [Zizania palustris]